MRPDKRKRIYPLGVEEGPNAGRVSIRVEPDDPEGPVRWYKCWQLGGGETSRPLPPEQAVPWLQLFLLQEAADRLLEAAETAKSAADAFADVASTVRQILNRLHFWGKR